MFRLGSNGSAGSYAGYMTFHRMDSTLMKSPSVGIPWRKLALVLGLAGIAIAGYVSIELVQSGELSERAVELLTSAGDRMSPQLASDLRPAL